MKGRSERIFMRYFGDKFPSVWTHRPIESLPPRSMVDTNVLLDAILIGDGAGAGSLRALAGRNVALSTTSTVLAEAKRTLLRIREGLPDITEIVDRAVVNLGLLVHDENRPVNGIKAHDSHVAAAALDLDAFVLTEDMPLLYDLDRAQLHGRCLREILFADAAPHPPHQDIMIFGVGTGADGHVFIKFMPHKNLGRRADRSWFLFDAPEIMSICYNGVSGSFELAWEAGGRISLPVPLSPDTQYVLAVGYSLGESTEVQMRVRVVGSEKEYSAGGRFAALERPPTGVITWMNSREKDAGWEGDFQNATFGPYLLNREVWRACHAIVGLAPPTLTADLTRAAALLAEIKGDDVRRPSRQDVLQLTNMSIPGFYPGRRVGERPDAWFE